MKFIFMCIEMYNYYIGKKYVLKQTFNHRHATLSITLAKSYQSFALLQP